MEPPQPPKNEFFAISDRLLFSLESTRIEVCRRLWKDELDTPRNRDPKRLLRHGYKVYSQSDEDGIIEEIFKRIGIETATFVEIGVGDGVECNTARLMIDSWSGLWIDNDARAVDGIRKSLLPGYKSRLTVMETTVTAENVNSLIGHDSSFDLLSIDIDFNDYWVWKAIQARPRVVVIEYNATWRPPLSVTVPYDANARWDGTNYCGASLEALVKLGREKGYKIVGCNYSGGNAFFVREDLTADKFLEPATSEQHYEPPRRVPLLAGHFPRIGPFIKV